MLHATRWKYRTQKWRKKSPSAHHRTTLSAVSSQLGHVSTIGNKLVKWQYLLHMFSQYSELRLSIGWDLLASLGHPSKISMGFASGTLVVGVTQTLRRWTEGATYIRQGGHHVGHWPTFLVQLYNMQWCYLVKDNNLVFLCWATVCKTVRPICYRTVVCPVLSVCV